MSSTDPTLPDPAVDQNLLKAAVRRGLLERAAAQAYWRRVRAGEGRAAELLVADGLLTAHVVETLATASDAIGPGARIGAYTILERLGQGGMGAVFKARHEGLDRVVALKLLAPGMAGDADGERRFLREARAAARISHPHVITVHDVGQEKGRLFMAMELLHGDAAQELAAAGGRLEEARALAIVADACRGLEAIHAAGLVHRDIKPANILIDAEGRAKLGDLGLAREGSGGDKLTVTGATIGTPAFMSPEQASGEAVDIRSDGYALGASLFALVCGREPHVGSNAFALIKAIVTQPAPDARTLCPRLSPGCAQVLRRALAKDPAARYQTPSELLADLEAVAAGREPSAAADARPRRRRTRSGGRGLWPLGLTAGGLLVLVLLLAALGGGEPAPVAPATPAEVPAATGSVPVVTPPAAAEPDPGALALSLASAATLREHWHGSAYHALWSGPALAPHRARVETRIDAYLAATALPLDRLLAGLEEGHVALHPWPDGRSLPADPADAVQLRIAARYAEPESALWGFLAEHAGAPPGAASLWFDDRFARRDGPWVRLVAPAVDERLGERLPGSPGADGDLRLAWRPATLAALAARQAQVAVDAGQAAWLARFDGELATRFTATGSSERLALPALPPLFAPTLERDLDRVPPEAVVVLACGLDGDALLAALREAVAAWDEVAAGVADFEREARANDLPGLDALAGERLQVVAYALGPLAWGVQLTRGTPVDRYLEAAVRAQGYDPASAERSALPLAPGLMLTASGDRWLIGSSVPELNAWRERRAGWGEPVEWRAAAQPALALWVDNRRLGRFLGLARAAGDGALADTMTLVRAAMPELRPSALRLHPATQGGYAGEGQNLLTLAVVPLLVGLAAGG